MEVLCTWSPLISYGPHIEQLFLQLVYVVWICFEFAFCYVYVIETRNRTLEETAAIFDGEDATELITGQGKTVLATGVTDVLHDDMEKGSHTHSSGIDEK